MQGFDEDPGAAQPGSAVGHAGGCQTIGEATLNDRVPFCHQILLPTLGSHGELGSGNERRRL
jgi:hypothetical protein